MQAKAGDTVRYLNSVGGGRITRIEGQMAYVDEDGFETPVLLRECVVVASGDSFYKSSRPAPKSPAPEQIPVPKAPAPQPAPAPEPFVETPEGEKLNIVLAFEPADIKHLSDTTFDAYLVNDSNYWLYITVATKPDGDSPWELRYSGVIEPQIQEFLFELSTAELPRVDRLSVQAIPFKRDKFNLKLPVAFEQRFDATRLARLHCFTSNPYFDSKVVAIDIVRDDVTQGRNKTPDAAALKQAMLSKVREDNKPAQSAPKRHADVNAPLEVDLHASELLDTTAGMSKADILNYQIDYFRRVMDENMRDHGRVIIFIHGKGEGVLRHAHKKKNNPPNKCFDVTPPTFLE
ncbi:MAG: DUF2027 domain-containing protein, partial [Muribaculaceae bacterium]|nr:DUF2027 domain-containing protein [Muribaculaceae bacterium]